MKRSTRKAFSTRYPCWRGWFAANNNSLPSSDAQYLVSTSLIVCGILSSVQITRFPLFRFEYYLGTGLNSVVGTSFAIIPVATGGFAQTYATGFCPQGQKLACPRGYGAILATACLCSLLEIALSFTKPRLLKRIFPLLVTGPTVTLIGLSLVRSGFQSWAGGAGCCIERPALCRLPRSWCPALPAMGKRGIHWAWVLRLCNHN